MLRPIKGGGSEANFRNLYRKYRQSATKRGHPFELTPERFRELVTSDCFVCGFPPTTGYIHDKKNPTPFISNGIDRIDNSQGYVEGNVAPCCRQCNYAKGKHSLSDLLLYIYRAYHHAIVPALQEGLPQEVDHDEDEPGD